MVRHLPFLFLALKKAGNCVMSFLETKRLILRPPRPSDIDGLAVWLGDYEVAKNTSRVPHPYTEADAEAFIAEAPEGRFVITRKEDGLFLGCIGLRPEDDYEFGYWLGRPFWGRGYATEAAQRLVSHAFESLGRSTVHAGWFHDNPASGHVLAKLGARHNGSKMRHCEARGVAVLCHDMLLTRADFLRKEAA
jgi:ribosomal-protein-alanine N-acetyltransferase